MTTLAPKASSTAPAYQAYLRASGRSERLAALQHLRSGSGLPIALAEDLLLLELAQDEKVALLESTNGRDRRALEHFLTRSLFDWSQDVAAAAVRRWARDTDHLLWFRLVAAASSVHLSQRVMYTILDLAPLIGGVHLVTRLARTEGLASLSSAFHSMILQRAMQWNTPHPALSELARKITNQTAGRILPDNKAMPAAVGYLLRFDGAAGIEHLRQLTAETMWHEVIQTLIANRDQRDLQLDSTRKFLAKPPKKDGWQRFAAVWPSLWCRDDIDKALVREAICFRLSCENAQTASKTPLPAPSDPYIEWDFLAGIPAEILEDALSTLQDDPGLARALAGVHPFLTLPYTPRVLDLAKNAVSQSADPAQTLTTLPPRLRLAVAASSATSEALAQWTAIEREQGLTLAAFASGSEVPSQLSIAFTEEADANADRSLYGAHHEPRRRFFDVAFRSTSGLKSADKAPTGDGYFEQLARQWLNPVEGKLADLAQAARQVEGVFRLCYIATLGQFKGQDQAALKLLDFIRSKDEDELRFVVTALDGIGTQRAVQELVATLTRPNATSSLRLEVCQILKGHDLSNLQSELRSAINDAMAMHDAAGQDEVREAMASLLSPAATAKAQVDAQSSMKITSASDAQLDQALSGKIQRYRELSSEVKRALRTSQFFHMQVSTADAPESIDLSPVIDMQYKALELLFREVFEEPCARLIHRGILQRRLDVIGYARPIPRAMDDFENYIGSLPIIREIPFFSKFKLRKMLRAICQYRPGKRFTLDGLKAFALFFLCFGRSECRYGLAMLFPLGCKDDNELFNFVKEMHILQDFRNRAAHEGFHPDASSDIDGIWRSTAEIVQNLFKVSAAQAGAAHDESQASDKAAQPSRIPIIERKKVS